jgi:hypothetical protein
MNTVLDDLLAERERLLDRITRSQEELKIVQRLIDRRTNSESEQTQQAFVYKAMKRPYHALKDIFASSPFKSFTPSELRDELETLKRDGLLKSNSNNLLYVVHSSIKSLIKKGIIKKESENDPPTYKFADVKTLQMIEKNKRLKMDEPRFKVNPITNY